MAMAKKEFPDQPELAGGYPTQTLANKKPVEPVTEIPDAARAAQTKLATAIIAFVNDRPNRGYDDSAVPVAEAVANRFFGILGPRQVDAMLTGE